MKSPGELELIIDDDGQGFDLEDELFMGRVDDGFGLDATTTKRCLGMADRLKPFDNVRFRGLSCP